MRFLGIDHGDKRIGLAVCDASEAVVSPLMVLEGTENSISKIKKTVEEYQIGAVVLGLPYNMDGTEGPRAVVVRQFADELKKDLSRPILFFDERLSSFEAAGKLAGLGLTRKGRKKRLDAVAAAAILEGFLETRKQSWRAFSGRFLRTSDAESLAQKALSEFLFQAERSLKEKGCFSVAICGGRTPRRFFERLQESSDAQKIDWSRVYLFWTDERAVPPAHSASNYRHAAETFLKTLPIPAAHIYRMEGEADDLEEAAALYENTLRKVLGSPLASIPSLDLILLGIGQDGHIASVFPGSNVLSENDSLVRVACGPDGLKRLTLTIPVIQAANTILVLVSGLEKAPILCTLLTHSPESSVYPVHGLWPVLHRTIWIADAGAASLLGTLTTEAGESGL